MKSRIRMIAIDLDGTLLNSQKRISERDSEVLQAAVHSGVEIVPVTGRNFYFALSKVELLPFDVPLIASNGAVIRSKEGETFLRHLLPSEIAAEVLEATRAFRPYTVLMYDQPGAGQLRIESVKSGHSPGGQTRQPANSVAMSVWLERNRERVQYAGSLEEALDGDPLEIMFAGPVSVMRAVEACLGDGSGGNSSGSMQPSHDRFQLLRTEYPKRDMSILDVIRAGASKGNALEYWSRMRGIAAAEVMAIGDNYNDLEMLRFAGLPVVMGNADEALKQYIKQQGWAATLDCDSGGVAHAIEQYVL